MPRLYEGILGCRRVFHLVGSLQDFINVALHVKRLLRHVVVLAFDNLAEAAYRVLDLYVASGASGELLGNVERLRQEALHLAGAADGQFVIFAELVNAKDGYDVLQVFVALQNLLHSLGHVVVLLPDNSGIENARSRGQRIHCRINSNLGQGTREHGGCIEVSEGGGRRRICQVIGGNVYGLHRSYRTALSRSNALLQLAHLGRQIWLIADGGRHAPQQRGNFRTCLSEAEIVVDKQQRVGSQLVAEIFRYSQRGERHSQASSRRLRHLAVNQGGLGFGGIAGRDHSRFGHLQPQVVAFAGTLTHTGEHRVAAMLLGNVVDELHDHDGFADPGATEQPDFPTLQKGLDQVDDLDAGLKHLRGGGLLLERGRKTMDGKPLIALDRAEFIHRLTDNVEHAAQRSGTDRYGDGATEVDCLHATHHAFGGLHGHATHAPLSQVLLHLEHDVDRLGNVEALADHANRLVNGRQTRFGELQVHCRAGDLNHSTCVVAVHRYESLAPGSCM